MEALSADKLPEQAGLLAYHYSRSANTTKALHYSHLAGRRASALYADTDAQHYWEECLRLLATQPQTPERDRQEIQTRLYLISVLSRQSTDDTPVRAQFTAAEAVCRRLNEAPLLAKVHATLAVAYVLWGRPQGGLPHARAAKDIADTLHDLHLRIITAGPLAHLLWIAGSFQEALNIAEAGIALVQEHGLDQEQMGFVIHPHAQCLAIAGACRGFLGDFAQGVKALRYAAELTERHGNRMPQAVVHWGIALVHDLYGQRSLAVQEAERALKIMEEVSPTTGVLLVGGLHEYLFASASSSQVETAQAKLARAWCEQCPFHELAGVWLATLQDQSGHREEAWQLAKAALTAAEKNGSTWFRYVAHWTLGHLLAQAPGEEAEAETHLRAAYDLATRMHSLPFLAHAAVELGELLWRNNLQSTSKRQAEQYLRQAVELGEQLTINGIVDRASRLLR
jgi:tetratricopeptide (TPR) repeat protein